jgi:P2 family phage contractile tail tube protein
MATSNLFKSLNISKFKVYLDGDPVQYAAEITLPEIKYKTISLDNSSMGGNLEVYDGYRCEVTGEGELSIEGTTTDDYAKFFNATKIYNMNISMAESNLNPQLGAVVPIPINYICQVQFGGNDLGSIISGEKKDHKVKFKLLSFKMKVNLISTPVDLDFVNGQYTIDGVDLMAAVTSVIG